MGMEIEQGIETNEETEWTAPLCVTVTAAAQEVLTWRTLARLALPMLERPQQYPPAQRCQLAQALSQLLDGCLELDDVFGDTNDDYEPGCRADDIDEDATATDDTATEER